MLGPLENFDGLGNRSAFGQQQGEFDGPLGRRSAIETRPFLCQVGRRLTIATSVSTRAMSPRMAVLIAAVLNLAGAVITVVFFQAKVSNTIGKIVAFRAGLVVIISALVGAIIWNLITWYLGLPSSSTHALVGALSGAALAAAHGLGGVRSSEFWKTVLSLGVARGRPQSRSTHTTAQSTRTPGRKDSSSSGGCAVFPKNPLPGEGRDSPTEAILKARSPSCGCHQIYDGTFSRRLVAGEGVTAAALRSAGVQVRSEEDVEAEG